MKVEIAHGPVRSITFEPKITAKHLLVVPLAELVPIDDLVKVLTGAVKTITAEEDGKLAERAPKDDGEVRAALRNCTADESHAMLDWARTAVATSARAMTAAQEKHRASRTGMLLEFDPQESIGGQATAKLPLREARVGDMMGWGDPRSMTWGQVLEVGAGLAGKLAGDFYRLTPEGLGKVVGATVIALTPFTDPSGLTG